MLRDKLFCIVTSDRDGGNERIAVQHIGELEAFRFVDQYNDLAVERRARMIELEPPPLPRLSSDPPGKRK